MGGAPGLAQSCSPSRQAPPSGGQDPEGGAGTSSARCPPAMLLLGRGPEDRPGLLGHREEGRGHRQNGLEGGAQWTSKLVSTLLWASVKLGRQRAGGSAPLCLLPQLGRGTPAVGTAPGSGQERANSNPALRHPKHHTHTAARRPHTEGFLLYKTDTETGFVHLSVQELPEGSLPSRC